MDDPERYVTETTIEILTVTSTVAYSNSYFLLWNNWLNKMQRILIYTVCTVPNLCWWSQRIKDKCYRYTVDIVYNVDIVTHKHTLTQHKE